MTPSARRPKHRLRSRDDGRQVFVAVAMASVLVLGVLVSGEYVATMQRSKAAAIGASDNEIYAGSILYMPGEGRICHQILFDNQTGLLSDNGSVDCEHAAYQGGLDITPKKWSSARLHVISTGFRDH